MKICAAEIIENILDALNEYEEGDCVFFDWIETETLIYILEATLESIQEEK